MEGERTLTLNEQHAILGSLRTIDEFMRNINACRDLSDVKKAAEQCQRKLYLFEAKLKDTYIKLDKELHS